MHMSKMIIKPVFNSKRLFTQVTFVSFDFFVNISNVMVQIDFDGESFLAISTFMRFRNLMGKSNVGI